METLLQDVRVALRTFRRSPGFPLAAIATLALGIGATTAIFTTLSAVLLKPLPYPNAQDLYSLRTALTDGRVTTGMLSGGEIYRLNDPKLSIERAAGLASDDLTLLAADGTPSHVRAYDVTEGFFELFGLPMTIGGFSHDDFKVLPPPPPNTLPQAGPPPRVVISARMWKDFYKGDPGVIGKPNSLRRIQHDRCRCRAARLRCPARRRYLDRESRTGHRHPTRQRRLHAPATRDDDRTRERR